MIKNVSHKPKATFS